MEYQHDFLGNYIFWEKQTKQFFEHNAAALDHFLSNPFSEVSLNKLMKHFKASIHAQQTSFNFTPYTTLSSYCTSSLTMTTEALDLLHDKIYAQTGKKTKTFRDFYKLWLECGEEIYQRWLKNDKLMSAFNEIIEKMLKKGDATGE